MTITRRDLIKSVATCAAMGSLGSMDAMLRQRAQAAVKGDRKFLFYFANGGMDATPFDPKYGEDGISSVGGTDMDPDTFLGQAGELTYSLGEDRMNMDLFFRRWGHRVAMLRGVNVHSAGHDTGRQWVMTGSSASSLPDWPTILASEGTVEYPMPHLVFSGPSYPGQFGASVVRGGGGTLLDLIDGSINGTVDKPAPLIPPPSDYAMDALVYKRSSRKWANAQGAARERMDAYLGNLERAMELEGRRFEAGLNDEGSSLLDRSIMALEVMRLGLSRCAMLRIPGGWDTHGGNQNVGTQLDSFFGVLNQVFDHMATTPGLSAPWLAGEVVVVVATELGRTPRFNGSMGRDHWPYASMLVAGSGVNGGQVFGKTDAGLISEPISLATGKPDSAGTVLGSEHVGTALLQLGNVDPERYLPRVDILTGLIRDSYCGRAYYGYLYSRFGLVIPKRRRTLVSTNRPSITPIGVAGS